MTPRPFVCLTVLALLSSLAQPPAAAQEPRRLKPVQPTPAQKAAPGAPATLDEKEVRTVPPDNSAIVRKGEELIKKTAFARTQSARTADDFTFIIDTCQQGLQSGVDQATVEYASKLMSWSHNRRGELIAAQASRVNEQAKRLELDNRALSDFETAIHLDEANFRAYHNRGVSYAQMRRNDEAMQDFDKTIEINPNYANAWFNRGELKYLSGKYRDAIEDYNRALRLNTRDWAAHNSRGHARYRLGLYREALEDYNQAVNLNPRYPAAYANRGDAYADQGYFDRAATDYRRAIELNASFGRAYQGAAWLMATCPEERYRDAKKAIEAAQKALELDGWNDYRYVDALAAAYANAERFDDAQETIKKAIEMVKDRPDQKKALEERLALYQENKPYRTAQRAVATRPDASGTVRPGAAPRTIRQ
jgi:tetratricopeptide (TPR) repeat protein